MEKKKSIKKRLLKIGFFSIFLALNLFIFAESLVPAAQSTETSMSWTNFFASIAEFLGSDKAKLIEPESIEVSGFETIIIGESKRLNATVLPEDATDKSIVWTSSDQSIAEVTSGGIVVAKMLGSIRVTAAASKEGVTSYIDIAVVDYPLPESFSIEANKTQIDIGTTTTIDVVNILPEKATKDLITWSSSPSTVASVNSFGVVKGLSEGVSSITATSGTFSQSINITVTTSPIAIVEPNMLEIVGNSTGYIYRYTQLSVNFGEFPPTDSSVTWLSSDENIAHVDKTGNVYGTKFEGLVTITAIANAKETIFDTVELNMLPVYPTSFSISASSLSAVAGNIINLTPTFDPEDVTNKELFWSSSDDRIATVSSKGDYAQVLGLRSGNVTITAVSKMDESITAQIELEILKAAVLTPNDRAELNNFIRKALGHFALFFVDGVMAFIVFQMLLPNLFLSKKILLSLGLGTFVASLSEIFQLVTEGRSGKFVDVLLDCFGFFSAVFLSLLVVHLQKRHQKKKHIKTETTSA